jgi:hypothetical protein
VKLDPTPRVTLEQIEAKQYAVPFAMDNKEIIKLGVNISFSSFSRGDFY